MPPHLLEMDGRPGRRIPFWRDSFLNSCQATNYSKTTYQQWREKRNFLSVLEHETPKTTENVPNIQLTWKKDHLQKRLVFLHLGSNWYYFKPHCWHSVNLSLSGCLTKHQKGSEGIYKIWTIFPIKKQANKRTHTHTKSWVAESGHEHFRK